MFILPNVKSCYPIEGMVSKTELRVVRRSSMNEAVLAILKKHMPGLEIKDTEKTGSKFFIEFSDGKTTLEPSVFEACHEAYTLKAIPNAVRIDAYDADGLFRGLSTFLFMPGSFESCLIKDSPSISNRCIHWDLKGYQPTLKTFLDELEILALFKVNGILLELEDKYDYECAPEIGVPGAYTKDDLRKISKRAFELGIEIIPKLQCLAHVDYLLKVPRYRNLRESDWSFQYCAVNPAAQKLWENMALELMECFREHTKFFHIGADESDHLGVCPECAKLGKGGSYYHKVEKCVSFLVAHNRIPMMWDDIVRNCANDLTPEEETLCRKIAQKTILVYWSYGYGGGAKKNVFPYIHVFRDAGIRVWGASGFSGCENWAGSVPPLEIRAENSDAWTKTAIENSLDGVIATGWTRIGSADCPAEPHESSWFTILYAACSMWSGVPVEFSTFTAALSLALYGCSIDESLAGAVRRIQTHPYRFDSYKETKQKRLRFLKLAAAAESLFTEIDRISGYMKFYYGRLGVKMPEYRVLMMRRYSKDLSEKIPVWKKLMYEALLDFYTENTADEFIVSRFGYLESLLDDFMKLLAKTKTL